MSFSMKKLNIYYSNLESKSTLKVDSQSIDVVVQDARTDLSTLQGDIYATSVEQTEGSIDYNKPFEFLDALNATMIFDAESIKKLDEFKKWLDDPANLKKIQNYLNKTITEQDFLLLKKKFDTMDYTENISNNIYKVYMRKYIDQIFGKQLLYIYEWSKIQIGDKMVDIYADYYLPITQKLFATDASVGKEPLINQFEYNLANFVNDFVDQTSKTQSKEQLADLSDNFMTLLGNYSKRRSYTEQYQWNKELVKWDLQQQIDKIASDSNLLNKLNNVTIGTGETTTDANFNPLILSTIENDPQQIINYIKSTFVKGAGAEKLLKDLKEYGYVKSIYEYAKKLGYVSSGKYNESDYQWPQRLQALQECLKNLTTPDELNSIKSSYDINLEINGVTEKKSTTIYGLLLTMIQSENNYAVEWQKKYDNSDYNYLNALNNITDGTKPFGDTYQNADGNTQQAMDYTLSTWTSSDKSRPQDYYVLDYINNFVSIGASQPNNIDNLTKLISKNTIYKSDDINFERLSIIDSKESMAKLVSAINANTNIKTVHFNLDLLARSNNYTDIVKELSKLSSSKELYIYSYGYKAGQNTNQSDCSLFLWKGKFEWPLHYMAETVSGSELQALGTHTNSLYLPRIDVFNVTDLQLINFYNARLSNTGEGTTIDLWAFVLSTKFKTHIIQKTQKRKVVFSRISSLSSEEADWFSRLDGDINFMWLQQSKDKITALNTKEGKLTKTQISIANQLFELYQDPKRLALSNKLSLGYNKIDYAFVIPMSRYLWSTLEMSLSDIAISPGEHIAADTKDEWYKNKSKILLTDIEKGKLFGSKNTMTNLNNLIVADLKPTAEELNNIRWNDKVQYITTGADTLDLDQAKAYNKFKVSVRLPHLTQIECNDTNKEVIEALINGKQNLYLEGMTTLNAELIHNLKHKDSGTIDLSHVDMIQLNANISVSTDEYLTEQKSAVLVLCNEIQAYEKKNTLLNIVKLPPYLRYIVDHLPSIK